MRRYGYGVNTLYKKAHISIQHGHFWIFWLEDVMDFICGYLAPRIKFPPIPMLLSKEDAEFFNDGKRWTNLREWWGSPDGWFCAKVHMPIADFCYKHIKSVHVSVEYNELKAVMEKHDPEMFKEVEDESAV